MQSVELSFCGVLPLSRYIAMRESCTVPSSADLWPEATQASGELPPGTLVYPDLDAVVAALTA